MMAPAAPLRVPSTNTRASSASPLHVLRTPYTRLTHEWFPHNVARNLDTLTFLSISKKPMIPTIRCHASKDGQGNYVQLFWGELTKGQHEAGAEQHKLGTIGGTTRGQAHRHPPITPKPPQPTHPPSQPRPRDTHAQLGPTGGSTNPTTRSWARQVEHGQPRPHRHPRG